MSVIPNWTVWASMVTDPSHPPLTVAFSRPFSARATPAACVRLYLDEELRDWFDVAEVDILHHE